MPRQSPGPRRAKHSGVDTSVVQERIATREEVLQTLTGYMHSGEPRDSVRLRAAELMGKHYGLFTDRIE